MKPFALLLQLCLALLFLGCEKAETPSFLHIEAVALSVNPNFEQGTDDHDIRDAWVYLNDNLVGIYEVPTTVPIIASGNQRITVIAGVLNNGIQTGRIVYPFYDSYETSLTLLPGDTIDFAEDTQNTINVNGFSCPVVEYFPGLVFWNERFEDPGLQFENTPQSLTTVSITQDPEKVFNYDPQSDSQGSARAVLTAEENYFEILSTHEFNPVKGQRVYLELNYKTQADLRVGVYETSPSVIKVFATGIFPKNEWSKIYIELTGVVAQQANATSYKLYIEGFNALNLDEAEVLLDNVKLIYAE